ncbi:nucleotidyl transferase AbiEii/AbiGii toxin family protein [Pararhizobium sp. YC-54]|uniref:nucleotidyl transferase AbiEii/AbiGii toxin family protein n=1 Tax=Pararhizobium sp. YC-54 TaxID=2986920 RepID=UPI0021F797F7|nr:nucleotidyl transferase AbiEii/AbiGii toxin family protein [Pararhizobium sp. YC-54]MCW0000432.1 nucleotidyl transferase AbiEii/AbiGii toxin family protein [Pararhizobium sp. YC-54]
MEHQIISEILGGMNHAFLLDNKCWFGGGTAIVLKLGEYRRSIDVDFLCSDVDGYRKLRMAAVSEGITAFFSTKVESLRDVKADQYGIRTLLGYGGHTIKFEVVREGRIEVDGLFDEELGVPTLSPLNMFAEKLLANADRCVDPSVNYRDAFDIGMLIKGFGNIPVTALAKVERAYGADIERRAVWVVNRLCELAELRRASDAVQMKNEDAFQAIGAFREECRRIWPAASIDVPSTAL